MAKIFCLTEYTCHPPLIDELADGLRSAFSDKSVPLWLAYAAQIFLDINTALRENAVRGLSELQAYGIQIASSLKEYHSHTSLALADWPAPNTAGIRHIEQIIDAWILEDQLSHVKLEIFKNCKPPMEPFALLKRHPMFCGLQFKLRIFLRHVSIDLAEAWGSILYIAHLYEAC